MISPHEDQLTTEGKLLCSAIIIAGLFEEGRLKPTDATDAEAEKALQEGMAAMLQFRSEAKDWPEAVN